MKFLSAPLNALVGVDLDQPMALEIERTGVADELKGLYDVALYLEFRAQL